MTETTTPRPEAVELRTLTANSYDGLLTIEVNGTEVATVSFDYESRQSLNRERVTLRVRPVMFTTPRDQWPLFTVGGHITINPEPEYHPVNETVLELVTNTLNDGKPFTATRKVWGRA